MRKFIYRIDSNGNIKFVNKDWLSFAIENKTEDLNKESVINKSIYDFIFGQEVVHLYRIIFDKVRKTGKSISIPFNCDSPEIKRYLKMSIKIYNNELLQIENTLIKEENRNLVKLFSKNILRSKDTINICSWCKKIEILKNKWEEVEIGMKKLNLMRKRNIPNLTHGICPYCHKEITVNLRSINGQ